MPISSSRKIFSAADRHVTIKITLPEIPNIIVGLKLILVPHIDSRVKIIDNERPGASDKSL